MILVNTSGDGSHTYPILAHSRWNGCTVADVVFPCFLFMVGIRVSSLSADACIEASRIQSLSARRSVELRSSFA